jgi:hypothetical protein
MQSVKTPPLFNFFDVVQIVDTSGELSKVDRKFGVVLGMSQADDGQWGYAVDVYEDGNCTVRIDGWDISQDNLVATGRRVSEDHIYGSETIRVSPDGEQI